MTKIWICEICIKNPRNPQNTDDSLSSGTKLFIIFLSLRFFDMRKERHDVFLSWLFHLIPPRAAPRCKLLVWPRRAPENQLPSSCVESQFTVFFQIQKSSAHRFRAWCHSGAWLHFLSGGFIVTSVIVTSTCTPVLNVCT